MNKALALLLLLAGALAGYLMTVGPLIGVLQAQGWAPTPCVITESRFERRHERDTSRPRGQQESVSYSLTLRYEYAIGDRLYSSDRYSFRDGLFSSGALKRQRIASKYSSGREFTCWVDPADPTRAVLNRGVTAEMLLGAFPLLLALVGAAGLGLIPARRLAAPLERLAQRVPAAGAPPWASAAVRDGWTALLALTALALFDVIAAIGDEVSDMSALGAHLLVLAALAAGYRRRVLACILASLAYPVLLLVAAIAVTLAPTYPRELFGLALQWTPASFVVLVASASQWPDQSAHFVAEVAPLSWLMLPIGWFLFRGARAAVRERTPLPLLPLALVGGGSSLVLLLIVGSTAATRLGGFTPAPVALPPDQIAGILAGDEHSGWQAACEAARDQSTPDPALVAGLIRVAGAGGESARAACLSALGRHRAGAQGALPVFTRALADPSSYVRLVAVQALGQVAAPLEAQEAVQAIAGLAKDPDDQVRRFAITALREFGPRAAAAMPALAAALADPSAEVRETAAATLGALGNAAAPATPELTGALADGAQPVRQRAAEALGRIGAEARAAVPALTGVLKDPSDSVRIVAIEALAAIDPGSDAVVATLASTLRDPEPAVRKAAVVALEALGPRAAAATPALIPLLAERPIYLRVYACQTLAAIGPGAAAALPRLRQMLTEKVVSDESELAQLPGAVRDAIQRIEGPGSH